MATINEIVSASNYVGNAALGSYIPTAIEIDTKPLMTLAAYAVMENKSRYDQRQIDTDQKIAELARLSQFDVANARGKDREEAISSYNQLNQFLRDAAMKPAPRTPEEKLNNDLDLRQKTQELTVKIESLNVRGLAYQKRLNDINTQNPDAKIREIKKKQLDDEFDRTDWKTPIASEEKFTAVMPTIGEAQYTTTTTSTKLGNQILQQSVTLFNPAVNMNNSISEGLGFSETMTLPPNATPAQVRQFELQQASGGQVKTLNDAANFLNQALANPKYKNPDGTLNAELVAQDNKIAGAILKGRDRYNQYATELKEDIKRGVYKTKMGAEIALDNVISDQDVFLIDKNKELKVEDLIFIEKFLKAAPDKEDEKIIQTNEQLAKDDNARQWFDARTSRINATKPSGGGGSDATPNYIKDPAILMKKHMENVINKFKNDPTANSGGNFAVNVSSIDGSTKKALGIGDGDTNKVVIYYKDGSIRVADGQVNKSGKILNNKVEVDLNESSKLFTLGDLKTGYISVVKAGTPEASQTEGFQKSAEAYFDASLGTNDMELLYNEAFNGVVGGGATTNKTPTPVKPNTPNAGGLTPEKLAELKRKAAGN